MHLQFDICVLIVNFELRGEESVEESEEIYEKIKNEEIDGDFVWIIIGRVELCS